MTILMNTLSALLIVLSLLPFVRHQHWVFRVPEFIKLQLLSLQVIVFPLAFVFVQPSAFFWVIQSLQLGLIIYHLYILMRYTKFWRTEKIEKSNLASEKSKVISCNVYQFNKEHDKLINLVQKE